jgi:hypothetical protein
VSRPEALDEVEATSSQQPELYLIGVAIVAGVVMTLLWVLREPSPVTALVPPAAFLVAFLVAAVRRDADARRQLGILLFFVAIGVLLGGAVVIPMPWITVTFGFLFAAAAAKSWRLLELGLASGIGVLLSVWPTPYAVAGTGLSLATLSPLLGAVAVVVIARLTPR